MKLAGIMERSGYVEVTFEGPFSADHIADVFSAIRQAFEMKGGSRVLLNCVGVHGKVSMLDRYKMGSGATSLPATVKLAFLANSEILDPQGFGERVARNRGINARRFLELAEAKAWLLGDEDPAPSV